MPQDINRPSAGAGGDMRMLDNPVWRSLKGVHRALALTDDRGRAARYPADVSPFMALPDNATQRDWEALARIAGPDPVLIMDAPANAPASWKLTRTVPIYQMVATDPATQPGKRRTAAFPIDILGPSDAGELRELARIAEPGPFELRTPQLGTFIGARNGDGTLIAMAGERMRPGGWTEISAICTHPDYRGKGLARACTQQMIDIITGRGERPFLHVLTTNTSAVGLYESMGFATRRTALNSVYQPD